MIYGNNLNRFAKNLEDILRIKNITQKELAEQIGVRPSTINQWVKGKREPEFDNLIKICYYLEIEPTEILGYKSAIEIIKALDEMAKNTHFSYANPLKWNGNDAIIPL